MSNTTKHNWRETIRSIFMRDLSKSHSTADIKRLMIELVGEYPKNIAPILHELKYSSYIEQDRGDWVAGIKLLRQCTRREEFEVVIRKTEKAALQVKDQMWKNGFSLMYHGFCEFHQGYEIRYRPKEAGQ